MNLKINNKNLQRFLIGSIAALMSFSLSAETVSPTTAEIQKDITSMLANQKQLAILPDIPNGAPSATLTDAAWFAWQEFIYLNWPNVPVSGANGTRESADAKKKFGQPSDAYVVGGDTVSYPALVWQTYRNKVEIYPGDGTPNGYVDSSSADYGYSGLPAYIYANGTSPGYVKGASPAAPFVNLDENSQIGVCQMFSGTPAGATGFPGEGTVPQNLILFLAKANRTQYQYVASRQWWNTNATATEPPALPSIGNAIANTSGYVVYNKKSPTPGLENGSYPATDDYVSFPSGTIELKSGWRLLTADETAEYAKTGAVSGYHVANIRYYPKPDRSKDGNPSESVDTIGAFLGLHINHKTPSAPYFLYATFEHFENIRDTATGNPIETQLGTLSDYAYSATKPTTPPAGYVLQGNGAGNPPKGQYLKDPTASNVFTQFATQKNPTGQVFMPDEATASTGKGLSGKSSYYTNTADSGIPADNSTNLKIDVDRRRFLIPDEVVAVNKKVQALIKQYGYNGSNNVWSNYRLTNIQWKPVDKLSGQVYAETNGVPPATYYQSNSMIETNIILSGFSGQFAGNNTITDYYATPKTIYTDNASKPPSTVVKTEGESFYNVYDAGTNNNMGGCMGCHGNRQVAGTDFSFIFAGGRVPAPDISKAANSDAAQKKMRLKASEYMNFSGN